MGENRKPGLVLGTHQTRSSLTFWDIVRRTPLQGNPIVCWKFCHVLHKLLRDGHSQTIIDSYRFRGMLIDLGKLWGHLKEAFGKLIHSYCNLLVRKINFHANYGLKFPGNLVMSDEQLDQIGDHESRVNVFFQLACDIFDYLEDILTLQATIFASVDPARGSSMMTAVQCRLAPLIPMIQDSSHLYDYSVKILFKLHKALPPGTLDGHRNRFNAQFRVLKTFYMKSSQLQYFKNLVQVPALPDCPPNFFHQSELQSHVTPIVTVASDNDDSPNGSEVTDTLIDLSHHHPTVPPPPNTIVSFFFFASIPSCFKFKTMFVSLSRLKLLNSKVSYFNPFDSCGWGANKWRKREKKNEKIAKKNERKKRDNSQGTSWFIHSFS